MKQYDLQVHTDASPCSRASPEDVVQAAVDVGLDGLAITNHDTLEGYNAVNALAPGDLTVIPGVEVTTTQGHLLALDLNEVPPQGDPLTVIHKIHEQEGLAVLSHPFDKLREYYTDNLDRIAAHIDGVEVLNSRCIVPQYNRNAHSFAKQHELSITGGSDAHFPMEVGRAYTMCEGSILDAIREGSTETGGRGGYLSGHIATKLNDALTHLNV